MALNAATVWEVRASTGSDNNGGGFNAASAGTDYSQQNSPQLSVSDGVTTGTTAVTSATGGFTTLMVGNDINIVGDGIYEITAFVTTNHVTVDRNTGTASGQTLNVGGALATLNKLAANMVGSNKAFVTGAFTSTSTITFAQSVAPSTTIPYTILVGYGVTRGDGVHATLTLSTNANLIGISQTGGGFIIDSVDVNCNSLSGSVGISSSNYRVSVRSCKISNYKSHGIVLSGLYCDILDCEVTGGSGTAIYLIGNAGEISVLRCYIHDNTGTGIALGDACVALGNIVVNNVGASSDGIEMGASGDILNNTIHGNGRHGINAISSFINEAPQWKNNILTSNGGFGIVGSPDTALPADPAYDGNAFFNNTSGQRSLMDSTSGIFGINPYTNVHDVTLTGSPYVGPTTGSTANFGLNNTSGAGAACRGSGQPSKWLGNTGSTGHLDMGAVQTSAGGASNPPQVIVAA